MIKVSLLLLAGFIQYLAPVIFCKVALQARFSVLAFGVSQLLVLLEKAYLVGAYEVGAPSSLSTKLSGICWLFIASIVVSNFAVKILKLNTSDLAIFWGSGLGTLGFYFLFLITPSLLGSILNGLLILSLVFLVFRCKFRAY